jgi:hypothetical protein
MISCAAGGMTAVAVGCSDLLGQVGRSTSKFIKKVLSLPHLHNAVLLAAQLLGNPNSRQILGVNHGDDALEPKVLEPVPQTSTGQFSG